MRDERLPRRRIIRARGMIRDSKKSGKRRSNRHFLLIEHQVQDSPVGEAAFITPKRLGAAPVRNRVRRRMREVYRRVIGPELRLKRRQVCLVWVARQSAASLDYAALEGSMLHLVQNHLTGQRSQTQGKS